MNPTPEPTPIVATGLTLDRGVRAVLRGLDWSVPRGTATGLLGRNGAGKSTLLHVVLGLLVEGAGTCMTLGQDARRLDDEAHARLGFVDQHYQLLGWLRVDEHVSYVARMHVNWDVQLQDQLLDAFELRELGGMRVQDLSPGARQRLAVLLALCHRPELIVLDEPVSAQDPIFRTTVLAAIRDRVIEDGATLIVSSHVLRDIESVVDRVSVLDGGRITVNEDLDDLKESYQQWVVVGGTLTDQQVADLDYVVDAERIGGAHRLFVRAGEVERRDLTERFGVSIEVRSLELERLFPLLLAERATEVLSS